MSAFSIECGTTFNYIFPFFFSWEFFWKRRCCLVARGGLVCSSSRWYQARLSFLRRRRRLKHASRSSAGWKKLDFSSSRSNVKEKKIHNVCAVKLMCIYRANQFWPREWCVIQDCYNFDFTINNDGGVLFLRIGGIQFESSLDFSTSIQINVLILIFSHCQCVKNTTFLLLRV